MICIMEFEFFVTKLIIKLKSNKFSLDFEGTQRSADQGTLRKCSL